MNTIHSPRQIITPRQIIKLIVIGDHNTGKSTIINKFSGQESSNNTNIEFYTKIFNICDNTVRLNIWDIKGYNSFDKMTNSYLREPNAFIIVFDITNKNSFYNIAMWLDRIKINNTHIKNYDYYPILLVGNKRDLHKERQVTFYEADTYAKNNRLLYVELSMHDEERINSSINLYVNNIFNIIYLYQPDNYNNIFTYANIFNNENNNENKKKISLSKSIENIDKLNKKYKQNRLCYKCYECSTCKKNDDKCSIL